MHVLECNPDLPAGIVPETLTLALDKELAVVAKPYQVTKFPVAIDSFKIFRHGVYTVGFGFMLALGVRARIRAWAQARV